MCFYVNLFQDDTIPNNTYLFIRPKLDIKEHEFSKSSENKNLP